MGRWSYLLHLVLWAVPVLIGQLVLLRWRYRQDTGRVLRAIGLPVVVVTAWLVLADRIAIGTGVWTFGEGRTLGVTVDGVVPLEEALFFLVTNALVAVGLALLEGFGVRRVTP
ncbi:MAG: lycopene cyclase domain-containing protein [bacterium]|nr:lycopene cyclase domain-containing protein [bacterium]